jgi:hypothetical protein
MTAITKTDDFAVIEQVLVSGDLARLTPEQRVTYYNRTCESLGLNPLTKPFAYISLNGKLVLYALRDCTDQLRKLNGVSIALESGRTFDGVHIVKARATDRIGRTDEANGAVFISQLKGEALANALMKAETKAKRRVTLSICGLGWLDESEVGDIPEVRQQLRSAAPAADAPGTAALPSAPTGNNNNNETPADAVNAGDYLPDHRAMADELIGLLRSAKSREQFREYWDMAGAVTRAELTAHAPELYQEVVAVMRAEAARIMEAQP